jgi:N-acetylglutamate synthase-like GNAT family acetyltransferase
VPRFFQIRIFGAPSSYENVFNLLNSYSLKGKFSFNLDMDCTFSVSDDKSKIDIRYVHNYLCNESYWAAGIPFETVRKSILGSLCFSVICYNSEGKIEKQVGFARVVTDEATFGYLADVFIDEKYRGLGLSKQLMSYVVSYPSLQGLRRILLATRDAHGLYTQSGFTSVANPEIFMHIHKPKIYSENSSLAGSVADNDNASATSTFGKSL